MPYLSPTPLFDYAVSRPTDPETSHIAAERVEPKLAGLRLEFVRRLRLLGEATAQEIAAGEESLRKRAAECVRLGMIRVVGKRVCKVTGNMAQTYRVSG